MYSGILQLFKLNNKIWHLLTNTLLSTFNYQLSTDSQLYTFNSQLKNIHRYHRTSLGISDSIVMVLGQIITKMLSYSL